VTSLIDVARALTFFQGFEGAEVEMIGGGLINESFLVRFGALRYVLQRVADIFDPAIHHNIVAVTEHLARYDIETPHLIPTRDGEPYVLLDDIGCWRLMTYVDGITHHKLPGPTHAEAAAALVGRFHRALDDLHHDFVGARIGVHDTQRHLALLKTALSEHVDHPLHAPVSRLAHQIATAAEQLMPLTDLPKRICHGDLKISNVMFHRDSEVPRAKCLIDLDTVGPMVLAHELGDAWRSWCNPNREDDPESATFDMGIFEASWRGYQLGIGGALDASTRLSLLGGPEWISLELAARFAADALRERYFGWDQTRFSRAGEHNLLRARGQWALHEAIVSTRDQRSLLLGLD
jgi:aminoglycoside phosphotransferase (APT) family kinase protein